MKAVVFTLGCKVNSYESSSLMRGLDELGYEVSDKLSYADLYIVNTCAVTAEAEKKSRQAIARVKKYNPAAKIIVTGCASQKDPKVFSEKEGVTLVTGAINKDKIIDLLFESGIKIDESKDYYQKFNAIEGLKTRAYIKIQDGCDNFCSYCIIPYLRGRSRSRSIDSILKELNALSAKEVVLTGINISKYDHEGSTLKDLISKLKDYPVRIRLGSIEDNIVDEPLLVELSKLPDFAEHFHLSLQSGSDKVLKEMNRKYTTERFLQSVELIRKYFKNAAITTDVIAGYSTETEEDFEKTIEFCKKVGFADIHCFEYSKREGTVGARLKELPHSVKKDRLNRLLALKKELREKYLDSFIGKELSFLPEDEEDGYTVGYTGNYVKVYVKGDLGEDFAKVRLKEKYGDGCIAEIINQ